MKKITLGKPPTLVPAKFSKSFNYCESNIRYNINNVLYPIGTNRWVFGDFPAISHSQSLQYVSIPALYRVRLKEKSLVFGCEAVLAVIKFFRDEAAKCSNTGVLQGFAAKVWEKFIRQNRLVPIGCNTYVNI